MKNTKRRLHRSTEEIQAKELGQRSRTAALREIQALTVERHAAEFTIRDAEGQLSPGYKGEDRGKHGLGDGEHQSPPEPVGGPVGGGGAEPPVSLPFICQECKEIVAKGAPSCQACGVALVWEGIA